MRWGTCVLGGAMLVTAGLAGTGADLRDPGGAGDVIRDFGFPEPRGGFYSVRLNLGDANGSTDADSAPAGPLGRR